jgi:hypothetical protein
MVNYPVPNQRHPRQCLAYRECGSARLELRVALRAGEEVCDVEVEEDDTQVGVFLFVCRSATGSGDPRRQPATSKKLHDCSVDVQLDDPVEDRAVVDLFSGRVLRPDRTGSADGEIRR